MKAASLLLIVALFAAPLSANNFRAADQIFLLAAAHAVSPWTTYQTDVWIANESADAVSVTVEFTPMNATPVTSKKLRDVIKLAPHQHKEYVDFLGSVIGASGFGYLVFNGCREGADCATDLDTNPNSRAISVESRTYSFATEAGMNGNGASNGQDVPGLPWWSYANPSDPVKITGMRACDMPGCKYRTNLVLVNASEFSSCWLTVTLYDGASSGERDRANIQLEPKAARQVGILELFPKLAEWSRLNRTRAATNAYVIVTQSGVTPTADAMTRGDDFADGRPSFFAFGSLIDAQSGDATTLEGTFTRTLMPEQFSGLFAASSPAAQSSAVRRLALKTASVGTAEDATARYFRYNQQLLVMGLAPMLADAQAKKMVRGEVPPIPPNPARVTSMILNSKEEAR